MKDGFIKVASGTPEVRVADVEFNKISVLNLIEAAAAQGVKILCLPELCLTGYTCGDLFLQRVLIDAAKNALFDILERTRHIDLLFALGLPWYHAGRLYNCAAVCNRGKLLGMVAKTFLPNYGEFYEQRWFAAGDCAPPLSFAEYRYCELPNHAALAPFGGSRVFTCDAVPGLGVGVEICEDLWTPRPPSVALALAGATVILNLSASSENAAKADYRRELVRGQSARLICGYVYADAGEGESSTDVVFAGHDLICENGNILAEKRFHTGLVISELDIERLNYERRKINTFQTNAHAGAIPFELDVCETEITREIAPLPFVPQDAARREERCEEIITIAALGLKKRLRHTNAKRLVIGLSGGLDSTLAALISARAMDMLEIPHENLIAVTMPGLGTTERTRGNAEKLAGGLRATLRTIPIDAAVRQHFQDIGHDESVRDVVYENAQARERTQVLMDIANGCSGLVVGTGDLSELALGWATYNGDHMSMYGVNAGIPKTLVRHLVAHFAASSDNAELSGVLRDILATPVSPELLPAENGEISQKTEALVGPYELHDFFLYHMIRWGSSPGKTLRLANLAFDGVYERETIQKWLKIFIQRFFAQQFKRSCLPDGPKVGTLSLSPRGDWRMPSDAEAGVWAADN